MNEAIYIYHLSTSPIQPYMHSKSNHFKFNKLSQLYQGIQNLTCEMDNKFVSTQIKVTL